METVSKLQRRLLSYQGNRSFYPYQLVELAERFSNLFSEQDGHASFIGTPAGLRTVLDDLLIIAGLLGIDAGLAVRRKYQDRCPRCLKIPCECWNIAKGEKPSYERPLRPSWPRSVRSTQQMLNQVFPHRHTLAQEVQRVREEMEELERAFFREHDRMREANLEEEVADVFAWLSRVANTLGIHLEGFIG